MAEKRTAMEFGLGASLVVFGVGVGMTAAAFMVDGYVEPARFCPAVLEHAPDTLSVVQDWHQCIEYTRAEGTS